jgi:hypothetical protein
MQFDGSINIDTRINTKGFAKGTKSMTSALGGVLNAVKNITKLLAAAFIGGSLINALRGVAGQFDLLSSSVGSKIKPLSDALEVLKGTFVNLIVQAFIPLIPYLVMFVQWLTTILSTVTQIIAALFGFETTVGSIMTKTAAGAKKSAKEVKGALAAFDQINVLEQQKADNEDDGAAGGITPPPITIPQDLLDKVKAFKEKFLAFIQPLVDAFQKIKDSPLWKTIGDALVWVWENILVPFATWFVQNFLPRFLEFVAAGRDVVNEMLIALKPLWDWLWENVLKPAGEALGEAIITALKWLTKKLKELAFWIANNQAEFQKIVIVIATLGAIIAIALLGPIGILIAILGVAIALLFNFGGAWDWVVLVASEAWKDITGLWGSFVGWFQSSVLSPLQNAFSSTLDWIRNKFVSVFESVKNFIHDTINGIISYINSMIQSIFAGLSALSSFNVMGAFGGTLGAAPAPPSGGGTGGARNRRRVPRLATGAVIPPNAEFAAILGDQKSGRNLEAPESLIRQIIREEMGGDSFATVPVVLQLDGETVWRNQQRVATRRGRSLIAKGKG